MRLALAFTLALALGFQADAQTPPKRRPFTEADYQTFFSGGARRYVSESGDTYGVLEISGSDGKLVFLRTESQVKWDRASLYPFVKTKTIGPRSIGRWDSKLKAQRYSATEDDLDVMRNSIVWLSNNNRPEISPDDMRIGTLWGYNLSIAKKRRAPVEQLEAWFRKQVLGAWTMRCEYVQAESYEVECLHTHLTDGHEGIRRFLKSPGMG